jgi:hypothetical protein
MSEQPKPPVPPTTTESGILTWIDRDVTRPMRPRRRRRAPSDGHGIILFMGRVSGART